MIWRIVLGATLAVVGAVAMFTGVIVGLLATGYGDPGGPPNHAWHLAMVGVLVMGAALLTIGTLLIVSGAGRRANAAHAGP